MARSRITNGLTISDIMNIPMSQFEKFTPTQQRELVSRLGSATNKRLRSFEKKGIENPATLRMNVSGGKISVRGKSGEELKNELFRAKQFLKSDFSTQTGWKKFKKKMREGLEKSPNITKGMKKDKRIDLAFSYYDVLSDTDPNITRNRDKYKIVGQILDIMEETTEFEEVQNVIMDYLKKEYEREQEMANSYDTSFSDWLQDIPERFKRR